MLGILNSYSSTIGKSCSIDSNIIDTCCVLCFLFFTVLAPKSEIKDCYCKKFLNSVVVVKINLGIHHKIYLVGKALRQTLTPKSMIACNMYLSSQYLERCRKNIIDNIGYSLTFLQIIRKVGIKNNNIKLPVMSFKTLWSEVDSFSLDGTNTEHSSIFELLIYDSELLIKWYIKNNLYSLIGCTGMIRTIFIN